MAHGTKARLVNSVSFPACGPCSGASRLRWNCRCPALLSFNGPRYNCSEKDAKQLCLYMAPVTLGENSSAQGGIPQGVGLCERFQGILGYPGEGQPWAVSMHHPTRGSLSCRGSRLTISVHSIHCRGCHRCQREEKTTDLSSREALVLFCSWLCRMGQDEGRIFPAFTSL